jgi:hypothetical protein
MSEDLNAIFEGVRSGNAAAPEPLGEDEIFGAIEDDGKEF